MSVILEVTVRPADGKTGLEVVGMEPLVVYHIVAPAVAQVAVTVKLSEKTCRSSALSTGAATCGRTVNVFVTVPLTGLPFLNARTDTVVVLVSRMGLE